MFWRMLFVNSLISVKDAKPLFNTTSGLDLIDSISNGTNLSQSFEAWSTENREEEEEEEERRNQRRSATLDSEMAAAEAARTAAKGGAIMLACGVATVVFK